MIVITLGEITGIGPEVVLKAIKKFSPDKVKIIGNRYVLEKIYRKLKISFDYSPYLLEVVDKCDFSFGKPDEKTARFALESLKLAVDLVKRGEAEGMVTAPICKENIWNAGFKFPGQTEFLAREFNIKNYSLLAYDKDIKITFLTLHTPMRRVSSFINADAVIEKGLLFYDFLSRFEGVKSPRIGVFSLNPHSDEFSLGEEARMKEGIKKLNALKIRIEGPLPADSFLWFYKKYNGFISPYHDQGMIIAKTISKGKGINTTLGLPFIRTSPLHGTAFDIAGKGIASSKGIEEAIRLCLKWSTALSHSGGKRRIPAWLSKEAMGN